MQLEALFLVEEELLETRRRELESTRRLFQVAMRDQVDVLGAGSPPGTFHGLRRPRRS